MKGKMHILSLYDVILLIPNPPVYIADTVKFINLEFSQ